MSSIQSSKGTAPSQEWSVITHKRKRRYDDSRSIAVANILDHVTSDSFRETWKERYPDEDPPERATISQLLGAYCYDPPKDIPQSYWTSALNRLEDVIDMQSRRCIESDLEDWEKRKFMEDLEGLRALAIGWYDTTEKDPQPQLLLPGIEDKVPYSERSIDWSDTGHTTQAGTKLNLWESRVRERIDKVIYDDMADERGGSS